MSYVHCQLCSGTLDYDEEREVGECARCATAKAQQDNVWESGFQAGQQYVYEQMSANPSAWAELHRTAVEEQAREAVESLRRPQACAKVAKGGVR